MKEKRKLFVPIATSKCNISYCTLWYCKLKAAAVLKVKNIGVAKNCKKMHLDTSCRNCFPILGNPSAAMVIISTVLFAVGTPVSTSEKTPSKGLLKVVRKSRAVKASLPKNGRIISLTNNIPTKPCVPKVSSGRVS